MLSEIAQNVKFLRYISSFAVHILIDKQNRSK